VLLPVLCGAAPVTIKRGAPRLDEPRAGLQDGPPLQSTDPQIGVEGRERGGLIQHHQQLGQLAGLHSDNTW
jgi:hypothetical protein